MKESSEANGDSQQHPSENPIVEISPLISYAGENLERFKGQTLESPVIIN